jgi:xyloglucan-specific exo-beta-1,4-glucanase
MKKLSVLFFLLFLAQTAIAQLWDFKNVNLQGMGYVTGLLIHPNTTLAPNTVYARTDVGGVYRLDNDNQRWIPLMDYYVSRNKGGVTYDVESFALDPQSAATIYASLAGVNLYPNPAPGDIVKSTDNGQTWQSTGFLATNTLMNANAEWRGTGERMAVDPNKSDIIYYGSRTSGLWRKDGSAAWQKVTGGLPASSSNPINQYPGFTFVVFDKSTGTSGNATQTIYVGLWESGIWRTTNGGTTWTNIGGGTKPTRGILNSSGQLLATFAANGGVQRYNGTSWTNITPSGQSGEDFMGISMHSDNPNTILANTFNRKLFRSVNSGTSWTELTMNFPTGSFPAYYNTYSPTNNYSFSPFDWGSTALTIDPNNASRVWMTNGYGVIKTDNIGTGTTSNWMAVMNNLEEIVTIDLKTPPVAGGAHLLAATADMVGWRITDRTVTPAATIADFDFVAFGGSVDFCQNQPQYSCFVGIDQTNLNVKYTGVTSNNGTTWQSLPNQTPGNAGVIAMSADNPQNMVWAPCCWAAPVYTLDGGTTWTPCQGIAAGWQHGGSFWWNGRNLVADRANGNRFYYLDQNDFYYSNDRGATWTKGYNQFPAWHINVTLVSNPWQQGELWATFARSADTITTQHRGLFHTTDGGLTFTELTTIKWANFVTLGKGNDNSTPFLYVHGRREGTNFDAIYKSEDRGLTWIQVSSPAQNQFANINVLEADQRTKDLVYVGTGGRGIFWGSAATPLPVEYLSTLTGRATQAGIELRWATATERSADRFEIQRSADGLAFEPIGSTRAKGQSSNATYYRFLHEKPHLSRNYYRIRQVDQDGSASLTDIVSVDWPVNSFQIYPNPVADHFNVQGNTQWKKIIVRNTQGQIVRTFMSSDKTTLAGLASGIYWMEIFERASTATPVIIRTLKK